ALSFGYTRHRRTSLGNPVLDDRYRRHFSIDVACCVFAIAAALIPALLVYLQLAPLWVSIVPSFSFGICGTVLIWLGEHELRLIYRTHGILFQITMARSHSR